MHQDDKCFACGRRIKGKRQEARTADGQLVFVGPDCHKHVHNAKDQGYQPPQGGPRLYVA